MSCDTALLDSLVHGELSPSDAASAATHVASCPDCALQLRYLSAERAAFQARAQGRAPLSQIRKGVMEQVRLRDDGRASRFGLVGAVAFGLCVALFTLLPSPGAVQQVARADDSSFCAAPWDAMCEDVPAGPTFTRALHSGGELVAEAEDGFHACLVASPQQGGGLTDACE